MTSEKVTRPTPRKSGTFGDLVQRTFPSPRDRADLTARVERVHAIADLLAALEKSRLGTDVPKAELARRMGTKPSVVSRLLTRGGNPTIGTILEILQKLDLRVTVTIEPRHSSEKVLRVRRLAA